jgi:RNA polymerase sigma-70 factor (ECF subfamily)
MFLPVVSRGVQPAEEFALDGSGSAEAPIEEFFQEHYGRIVNMLARLTGNRAQAEEVASEVFARLARRRVRFALGHSRTAWLYRVATNAGLDALRVNTRRRKREEEAVREAARTAVAEGALENMLREERRARVRAVLSKLKPRDAELLLLRSSGLAYRELAEAVGIRESSVGTMLARAEAEFERRYRAAYGVER